jgi:hypothetical protein
LDRENPTDDSWCFYIFYESLAGASVGLRHHFFFCLRTHTAFAPLSAVLLGRPAPENARRVDVRLNRSRRLKIRYRDEIIITIEVMRIEKISPPDLISMIWFSADRPPMMREFRAVR